MEDACEEWVRHHNDWVDRVAGITNANRPHALLTLQAGAISHHVSVANFFVLLVSRRLLMPVRLAQMQWLSIILKRSFPLLIDCIANIVRSCFCPCQIMPKFQHCLFPHMRWLDDHTDVDCDVYDLSFEELALALAASDFSFPLRKPQTGRMELVSLSTRYEKATLSYLFFCIRQSFRVLRSCCDDFDAVLLDRHNKVHLGVHRPCGGFFIRWLPATIQLACSQLIAFTMSRPIRRPNDLARPVG